MQRCIEISRKGISAAAPNPSVGAVLVYDDKIIGEGYTSPYGGKHAEVNCIESVKADKKDLIKESILYVSLEPCSHYGKTAPCSLLIIDSGIKKVIIGSLDPNPLVAGKGIKILKEKGIAVVSNVLHKECVFINRRFYTFYQKKRPYIVLKWAQTKNDFFSKQNNEQFWITNQYSKQLVHKWRTEEMSILVGKTTAKTDNPQLNTRLYKGKNPMRIVIDKLNELPKTLHIFDQSQKTIIYNDIIDEENENLSYCRVDFSKNIIPQILLDLYIKNINSVIVEGGSFTLQSFIDASLWDEARILTGNVEIEYGNKAPIISKKKLQEFTLNENHINIIINKLNL